MNNTKAVAVKQSESLLVASQSQDLLTKALKSRVSEFLQEFVIKEADAFLDAISYQRTESRRGYRHGSVQRELTTSFGKTTFDRPRVKVFGPDGRLTEWKSSLVPRYSRRCQSIDATLMGLYFGGVNTRKVSQALRPILKGSPLSKSAISRVIVRIRDYFDAWRARDLSEEDIRYLYLDGTYVSMRCAGKVTKLPVLAVIGVRATGEKVLLDLDTRGEESGEAWEGLLQGLARRGLRRPLLAIVDGNAGLSNALERIWPGIDRQRCTVHKLRNLESHAPKHLREEIRTDFNSFVYAEDALTAKASYDRMLKKWKKRWDPVARSLAEAGPELLTFQKYPKSQWKSLRTTNAVENLNNGFKRRTKTQGSFPTESSVLVVLFGLVASGMIRLRKIGGYRDMPPRYQKTLSKPG